MKTIIATVVAAYLEAAAFTDFGPDEHQCPEGSEFSRLAQMPAWETCADFLAQCEQAGLLAQYESTGRTWDSFGNDLWFTRNGHGAGFWDRGMGKLGEQLSDVARRMGSVYCYEGDDTLIYWS